MNKTTDFAQSPAENAGVLISALGANASGVVVASLVSLPENEQSQRPARKVATRKSRGIPELDSPMAG